MSTSHFERRWNPMVSLGRQAFIEALAEVPPKPADMERILASNRDHRDVETSAGAAVLGVGTAMVYPTLLAAIGSGAISATRSAPLVAGASADALGLAGAMLIVAGLTLPPDW